LRSEAQLIHTPKKQWHPSQIVAWGALATFGVGAYHIGLSFWLLALTATLWCVAEALTGWRHAQPPVPSKINAALYPFGSLAEVFKTYRATSGFKKVKYPPEMKKRWESQPSRNHFSLFEWFFQLAFSPLFLFALSFPMIDSDTRTEFTI
jgi:hypothetical protein